VHAIQRSTLAVPLLLALLFGNLALQPVDVVADASDVLDALGSKLDDRPGGIVGWGVCAEMDWHTTSQTSVWRERSTD